MTLHYLRYFAEATLPDRVHVHIHTLLLHRTSQSLSEKLQHHTINWVVQGYF